MTAEPSAKSAAKKKRVTDRNLPVAIGSAVVLLVWILGSLLFFPWGFVAFLVAAVLAGSFELVRALNKVGMNCLYGPIAIGGPATIIISYWTGYHLDQWAGLATVMAGLALMVVASMVLRLRGPVKNYAADIAGSVFTIGYVPLLLSMTTLLLAQPKGNLRVILYILLVACCDTSAYAVGSLIGKHKMAPHISPGKTWEGLIGAVIITAGLGAVLGHFMIDARYWAGAIIGALLALAGATGDLAESMLKRDTGVKDMGRIIPGHGGAMDRLDSLLLAAPVAWFTMFLLVP